MPPTPMKWTGWWRSSISADEVQDPLKIGPAVPPVLYELRRFRGTRLGEGVSLQGAADCFCMICRRITHASGAFRKTP
jgi:hypothetical protein